jgi:hypothetical protein
VIGGLTKNRVAGLCPPRPTVALNGGAVHAPELRSYDPAPGDLGQVAPPELVLERLRTRRRRPRTARRAARSLLERLRGAAAGDHTAAQGTAPRPRAPTLRRAGGRGATPSRHPPCHRMARGPPSTRRPRPDGPLSNSSAFAGDHDDCGPRSSPRCGQPVVGPGSQRARGRTPRRAAMALNRPCSAPGATARAEATLHAFYWVKTGGNRAQLGRRGTPMGCHGGGNTYKVFDATA